MDRRFGVLVVALWMAACGDDGATPGMGEADGGGKDELTSDGGDDEQETRTDAGPGKGGADAGTPEEQEEEEEVLARTKGIGRPCSVDTDCEAGQTCHEDTENYVSHGQCVVHCTSTAACEGAFGKETMCIGAEVCVAECLSDDDCPEKTVCNEAGWCARQGPGSGVPYCSGSATPCAGRGTTSCLSSLGCFDDSDCTGSSRSCYNILSSSGCIGQDGCYWSSYDSTCSGSSYSCSSILSEFSCEDQMGCYWQASCTGVARACESVPLSVCTLQPGCFVENGD